MANPPPSSTRLRDKVGLVTGGAAGLGLAIAQRMAMEGAQVMISDIQPELGRSTATRYGFVFLEHDVCDEPRWVEIVQDIAARYGRLDILVNNAGIAGDAQAANPESTSLQDWHRVLAVNVDSVLLGCRAAIPAMKRSGGGSIVNISSIAAMRATPYATAYGASKAAVTQLTKSIAQYCAEQRLNIRCNSVHPGVVDTQLWRKHAAETARSRGIGIDDMLAEAKAAVPLGDLTCAEDVAAAVAFFASGDARHITGTKVIVDGGIVNCETYRSPAGRS